MQNKPDVRNQISIEKYFVDIFKITLDYYKDLVDQSAEQVSVYQNTYKNFLKTLLVIQIILLFQFFFWGSKPIIV